MINGYKQEFEDFMEEEYDYFQTTWCRQYEYETFRTYAVKIATEQDQSENIHATLDVYNDYETDPEINCAIDGRPANQTFLCYA